MPDDVDPDEVEAALQRARAALDSLWPRDLDDELLRDPERHLRRRFHERDPGAFRAGTKPLLSLVDDDGNGFILKLAPPPLVMAEEACFALRRLGGRPALAARAALVHVEGVGEQRGLLKPWIDVTSSAELSVDSASWTPLQRAVMLLEQACGHFLDNLDTNTTQYALVLDEDVPVNIDWDRAFASEATTPLSRFAKYKPTLPNARTFLYADFVEGRTELPFAVLAREARRIRALPKDEVRAILLTYARVRYASASGDAPARLDMRGMRSFLNRSLERRRRMEHEALRFVRALRRERARLRGDPRTFAGRVANLLTLLRDRWQILLHAVVREPLGDVGRRVLKRLRARSLPG